MDIPTLLYFNDNFNNYLNFCTDLTDLLKKLIKS